MFISTANNFVYISPGETYSSNVCARACVHMRHQDLSSFIDDRPKTMRKRRLV